MTKTLNILQSWESVRTILKSTNDGEDELLLLLLLLEITYVHMSKETAIADAPTEAPRKDALENKRNAVPRLGITC